MLLYTICKYKLGSSYHLTSVGFEHSVCLLNSCLTSFLMLLA